MRPWQQKAHRQLLDRREALLTVQHGAENATHEMQLLDENDWPDRTQAQADVGRLESLADRALNELKDIEAALLRIERGDYGLCESCGGPVGRQRLAAIPEARFCIGCSSMKRAFSPVTRWL
jgi:DnaK suppressor protein